MCEKHASQDVSFVIYLDKFNRIIQRIEAQLSKVAPGARSGRTVAGVKGAAAEGDARQASPGQTDKIRLTVAFAESYGLIVKRFPAPHAEPAEVFGTIFSSRCKCSGCVFFPYTHMQNRKDELK